ncbi:hypothetical protein LTR08_001141 [Meristemomyces frigidus]|nr:hypothetical protein LTR08_001141 [Meristemomyces frigidus]
MPPSQLNRLKSSLRDQGITGPQKSKKQKKAQHTGKAPTHAQDRQTALQQIRDSFNPFELRPGSARPAKFESVSHASANKANGRGGKYKEVLHRPGVTKSAGEEMRRRQLLPEMQRRNKVGGLVDRRIGEGDAGMSAEERAVQRFAREKERGRSGNVFDLEGSDGEQGEVGLTHLGRSLGEMGDDDFAEGGLGSDASGSDDDGLLRRKRPREDDEDDEDAAEKVEGGDDQPDRKKTKKEVMTELIAKSKMHKYERQKTKEDDDDLREELDKGMADMLALLTQGPKPVPPPKKEVATTPAETDVVADDDAAQHMNPDRQRLLDGMDRVKADKEYEVRLRQLAQDTRAKPSERTKTTEEKAVNEAKRLKELEEKRTKRMRGEEVSDDEEVEEKGAKVNSVVVNGIETVGDDEEVDEAAEFGFAASAVQPEAGDEAEAVEEVKVVHDDEDEFDVDGDLIASESDVDPDEESSAESESDSDADPNADGDLAAARDEEEDDEFVKGILGDSANGTSANSTALGIKPSTGTLSYTYPCPRAHADLLSLMKDQATAVEQLPTVIQRIRALHHTSLAAANKESMADFAAVLVDHIAYMGEQKQSLPVMEQVIRHLHSLSRTYPTQIAEAFRKHLKTAFQDRGNAPNGGDLVILTAIGNIYPTSDHFHQVVTPAITIMARWLGLGGVSTEQGAFLAALIVSYQKLSKRVVPEALRFTLRTIVTANANTKDGVEAGRVMRPHLENLAAMADLWKDLPAFPELFAPAAALLAQLASVMTPGAKQTRQKLAILLQQAYLSRRPLTLHYHKAQPIRTSIPKFEEGFNPDKHYDPDKERSESRKLRKEVQREKKGAVRELRKDGNFIAREQLGRKRTEDAEYEKKQRRLVAEIQGEAGAERREGFARERAAGGGARGGAARGGRGGRGGRGRGR